MTPQQRATLGLRIAATGLGAGVFGGEGPPFAAVSAMTTAHPHTPYSRQAGLARLNPIL